MRDPLPALITSVVMSSQMTPGCCCHRASTSDVALQMSTWSCSCILRTQDNDCSPCCDVADCADEREAIQRVIAAAKPPEFPRSPITGVTLDNSHLVTNRHGLSADSITMGMWLAFPALALCYSLVSSLPHICHPERTRAWCVAHTCVPGAPRLALDITRHLGLCAASGTAAAATAPALAATVSKKHAIQHRSAEAWPAPHDHADVDAY